MKIVFILLSIVASGLTCASGPSEQMLKKAEITKQSFSRTYKLDSIKNVDNLFEAAWGQARPQDFDRKIGSQESAGRFERTSTNSL